MICIILVAGHGTVLEQEIQARWNTGYLQHMCGVPKALLPGVGGRRILDFWWEAIKTRQLFKEVYMVTNADKYKHYERWATASEFPVKNIINDGTTTYNNRLGSVADVDLVLKTKVVDDDVMVVAGDMLFQDAKFDMAQVLNYFHLRADGDLAIYYQMEPEEKTSTRGIVTVDVRSNRITEFFEKPSADHVTSRLASVVFYCFRKQTLAAFGQYLDENRNPELRHFGKFMEWYINQQKQTVYGMKLPTGFQLIGQVTLDNYKKWLDYFAEKQKSDSVKQPIVKRAYARVALVGNPSDNMNGKTIALSIKNFWAEVTIVENDKLVLQPHPLNDPTEFGSLADLHGISRKEGYMGGLRLLQATCKKFYQYCSQNGVALAQRNFNLKYDTNIPRQVGLAGSSAIVTATLKCLMQFFNLSDADVGPALQPAFVLGVEMDELGIQAGLQDRVVQIYEGLVYMDFNKDLLEAQGHGNYEHLPLEDLPPIWLAYLGDPSDSGKIHSSVGARWRQGDPEVVEAVQKFISLSDSARNAIHNKDWENLVEIMDANFNLRRSLYGDAVIGAGNLRMIEIARSFGSAAKFPGSGGAVVGICLDAEKLAVMKTMFQTEGFVFCDVIPNPGGNHHNPPQEDLS